MKRMLKEDVIRLHGEIRRLMSENPNTSQREVLKTACLNTGIEYVPSYDKNYGRYVQRALHAKKPVATSPATEARLREIQLEIGSSLRSLEDERSRLQKRLLELDNIIPRYQAMVTKQ